MTIRLAPSILAADFAALGTEMAAAERGGAYPKRRFSRFADAAEERAPVPADA